MPRRWCVHCNLTAADDVVVGGFCGAGNGRGIHSFVEVQQTAGGLAAGPAVEFTKQCDIEFEAAVYKISFISNENLSTKIDSHLRAANSKIPGELNLKLYQVLDCRATVISSFYDLVAGEKYTFALPRPLQPAPSNKWTIDHVKDLLKINFMDECDFIEEHELSSQAKIVLAELEDVTGRLLPRYKGMNLSHAELVQFRAANAGLTSSLKKTMYAVDKFTDNEATVDSFLNLLLFKLGFFEAWLLPIPQHAFQLELLNCAKDAFCDLCIVDVVSFALMMAVAKDKSLDNERVNSEDQLFAAIIAAVMQLMSRKRKFTDGEVTLCGMERTVFGLRLNGLVFHFYEVMVSDAMLNAVRSGRPTCTPTSVRCRKGLDFRDKEDREVIIGILDKWRDAMVGAGERSKPMPSCGKNTT